MSAPPPEVLDLFAVPGNVTALSGGSGNSHRAGDLVLSPGRDDRIQAWLSPVLAHLAVRLDENPARRARDLRVAMPVPARDGSWVVNGWAACRYEPEAVTCRDLGVTLAAGRLLHAQLAAAVRSRPPGLNDRRDQWARAERLCFGPAHAMLSAAAGTPAAPVIRRVERHLREVTLGPDQLVHADLAGNVLLDARGAPVIIDVAPYWRPTVWAEAVAVVDSVAWFGASSSVLGAWTDGVAHQAALRALLFRAFADRPFDPGAYSGVLDVIAST